VPEIKSSHKRYTQAQLSKILIKLSGNSIDHQDLKSLWWNHTDNNSLRLTLAGFEILNRRLGLKTYIFEMNRRLTSKNLLQLERQFPSVYYLLNSGQSGNSKIAIFDEDIASMLTLIDGNLEKYLQMLENDDQNH
jgi:hypothetical protein